MVIIKLNTELDKDQYIEKNSGDQKMCESTVYSTDKTTRMEDVLNIKINGDKIYLTDILGMEKDLSGTIVEIDLDKHGIFIKLK